MPQLIFSSEFKGEFPSFVIDIFQEQIQHLIWMDIIEVLSIKLKVPTNLLYIKSIKGGKVTKKNFNKLKFNIDNFRMQYSKSKIKNNDYLFSFGIKI